MPSNNFTFESALAAAQISAEAFAAEFEMDGANANIQKYGTYGTPLLHTLIG